MAHAKLSTEGACSPLLFNVMLANHYTAFDGMSLVVIFLSAYRHCSFVEILAIFVSLYLACSVFSSVDGLPL